MSIRSFATRLIGAAALVLALLVPATAAGAADPQSSDASSPAALAGRLQGTLGPAPAGGWAGATDHFAYYAFEYPGDESTVSVNLQVYPDDETILDQVGFELYGPRTIQDPGFVYVAGGGQPKQIPNVSANLISRDKGTYLVQVHNDSSVPIYFTIWADGLPQSLAPAPPISVVPAPAGPSIAVPAAPAVAPPVVQPIGAQSADGSLAPGQHRLFEFSYAGDETVDTVNLQISPDDPVVLDRVGFQVFQPDGTLQVRGGAQPKLTPNVSANVISPVAGRYTVKVYNDDPSLTVHFSLSLVTGPRENTK